MSFENTVQALRHAKAQELKTREVEQAAELAHEAQFMTLGDVGCAAMARHQLGATLDAWRLVYEALRDLPDLELFCRWHGDRRWVPLPGGPVKPSYSAGETNGPCYMLPTSPGQIPSPDPLGSALGQCNETAWWPLSCLAIRREVAERVFGLDRDTTEKPDIPTGPQAMDDVIVEPVAPLAKAEETSEMRRERIRARWNYWKGQGVRNFTARVAEEEGLSVERIGQILRSGKTKPKDDAKRARPRQKATFCSDLIPALRRTR